MSEELLALRNALARARKNADEAQSRLKDIVDAFEADENVILARDFVKKQKTREAECAAALREAILDNFAATDDKAPLPGLGVREIDKTRIVDSEKAREWALTNAPCLLMINEAVVIDFHEHVRSIPGVESETIAQATIAAKLPEE